MSDYRYLVLNSYKDLCSEHKTEAEAEKAAVGESECALDDESTFFVAVILGSAERPAEAKYTKLAEPKAATKSTKSKAAAK